MGEMMGVKGNPIGINRGLVHILSTALWQLLPSGRHRGEHWQWHSPRRSRNRWDQPPRHSTQLAGKGEKLESFSLQAPWGKAEGFVLFIQFYTRMECAKWWFNTPRVSVALTGLAWQNTANSLLTLVLLFLCNFEGEISSLQSCCPIYFAGLITAAYPLMLIL